MNRTDSNHALQTDLFEDRLALSMPPAAAIEATDVEPLANVIEILGALERRVRGRHLGALSAAARMAIACHRPLHFVCHNVKDQNTF